MNSPTARPYPIRIVAEELATHVTTAHGSRYHHPQARARRPFRYAT
jgi:hypothetical protein